jgi:hypothetical protein
MSFDDVMTCTSMYVTASPISSPSERNERLLTHGFCSFESFYAYNPFISDRAGDDRDEIVLPICFTTGGLFYKGF